MARSLEESLRGRPWMFDFFAFLRTISESEALEGSVGVMVLWWVYLRGSRGLEEVAGVV